jgi:hypothetical protein
VANGKLPAWRSLIPEDLEIQFAERVTFGDGTPADLGAVFWPALEFVGKLTAGKKAVRPKVVLSALPMFNAEAVQAGRGVIRLNLGLVAAFLALPSVGATLREALGAESMLREEVERLTITPAQLAEMDSLFALWRAALHSGWTTVGLPRAERGDFELVAMLERLVVGHEVGHLSPLFDEPGAAEERRLRYAGLFDAWQFECERSPALARWATFLDANPAAAASWEEEVRADQIGYVTAWTACQSAQEVALLNAASATLFCLQELFEAFLETEGIAPTAETHPPAAVRRDAFTWIRAQWLGLPEKEFLFTHWGAGWLATFVLRKVAFAYLTRVRRCSSTPDG